MDDKLHSLIIGALLHDIGKLLQRSGGIFFNEVEFKNKKMSHSAYGYGFVKKLLLEDKWDVAKCVLYHHASNIKANQNQLKDDDLAYIVYEADNIAAGADRRENDELDEQKFTFEREATLKSIFNVLKVKESQTIDNKSYYLKTLKEGNDFNYPVDGNIKATKSGYQEIEKILNDNLKDDQTNDIKGLPINKGTINSLLQILEATSSYIPSDTYQGNVGDISLYDHLKLTASLASCMYLYYSEKGITNYKEICFNKPLRDENYFLLVSGDLSGVQDFIYTIASKGALKSLRARSFYLDLLLEHIVDEILEKLELSRANLIYTGGGHFYMLLPKTDSAREVIKKAKVNINEWFLRNYGTGLYLALDFEECCPFDFMSPEKDTRVEDQKRSTKDVFREVSKKLSRDKLKRYTPEQLKDILDPNGKYNIIPKKNNYRECDVCHTSQGNLEERKLNNEVIFDNGCLNCWNLYLMGKELVFKAHESINKVMPVRYHIPETKDKTYIELPILEEDENSVRIMTLEDADWVEKDLKIHPEKKYVRIYTKNKWMAGLGISTNLWMGDYNKDPSEIRKGNNEDKKEGLIEFKELAEKSSGIKRLAVMRADVDDLGYAFVNGFDEKYGTLSRYTTFSRQLSLFFKHYINNVCKSNLIGADGKGQENFIISREMTDRNKHLVIVYSGGDDVFIVGAWNDVIDFAVDLRSAFRQYTNNKLTFSAGIGFYNHSFPIYQMANLTGKLEDKAKEYKYTINGESEIKNSIALFGIDKTDQKNLIKHVYTWDEFIKDVYPKVKYFIDHCDIESDKISRDYSKPYLRMSFLYKLLILLDKDYTDGKYSINLARLAYLMARIESNNEKQRDVIKQFKTDIYHWASEETSKKELLTAINILVYLFRDKSKHKQLAKGG